MFDNKTSMTPNPLQQQILDLVHERRIVEHVCENGEGVPSKTCCPEPLLRLIHGLPGSGKTQVLRWLQSYFEEVWSWTLGLEFVFTAPLNSMASSIQGSTIHSNPPQKIPGIQNSSPGSQIQIELFKLLVQTSELQVWNPISGLCLNNENIETRYTHESI